MALSDLVERLRVSARKKKQQIRKAIPLRSKHRLSGSVRESDLETDDTFGKSTRSSTLLSDDPSLTASSIASSSVITGGTNSDRHSWATSDEGDPGNSKTYYGVIKRKPTDKIQVFSTVDKNKTHASTATLTSTDRQNDLERVVFLQYQGETKRAVLPVDPTENSVKTALRSLDDVRALFVKAFPDELPVEYLRATNVKIYIQDSTKSDFFYELDDLNDVKDRSVLKLHEPSTRPNSPPPPPTQPTQGSSDQKSIGTDRSRRDAAEGSAASGYNRYQRRQSNEDMNYFSEPEFDASGEYRLQKSASANYYGGVNTAYQQQQRRHYGTIDRIYGYGNGSGTVASRSSYDATGGPPKPERHFGPGIPSGGRSSVRGSYSPPRRGEVTSRHAYGQNPEQEEPYTRIGYREYLPSPTAEAAVDAIYQQRPTNASRSGSATPVIDEEARVRMINMEKQLASLSSLVHSALMSKGVSDNVYKDLEMLRREILTSGGPPSSSTGTRDDVSDTGSVSRFSDLSSEKGSYQSTTDKGIPSPGFTWNYRLVGKISDGNSSAQLSPTSIPAENSNSVPPSPAAQSVQLTSDARHQLKNAKRRVTEVQVELKNLRRLAQLNAQCSRDILRDAFDRLKVILNTNQHLHMFAEQAQHQNMAEANAINGDRKWVNQEEDRYRTETRRVEKGLSSLERDVEDLRQSVVNGERKLRMSEVEAFTDTLTQIGRSAANLKNNFPSLEDRLRSVMSAEMEKVVREEKFLKDEPNRLDNALKRCKKLANTMVTMKKLAMVQDPSAYYKDSKRPPLPSKSNASSEFEGSSSSAVSAPSYVDPRRTSPPKEATRSPYANGGTNGSIGPQRTQSGHVLDNLLEELQSVASPKNGVSPMTTEKRVGFADRIQVRDVNDSGSDTIKRAPRPGMGTPDGPTNSILRTSISNVANSYSANRQQTFLNIGVPDQRRSESPSPMASSFRAAIPFLHGGRLGAPNRSPASSVTSEPVIYRQQDQQRLGFIPPPPPRSSSRNVVDGNLSPRASSDITSSASMSFRSEFEKKQRFFAAGSENRTPAPIVQTNAVDDEPEPRYVKSASSSESVNSQDGQRRRLLGANAESDKAPPPPPPRNKQEMLEQRQHELMTKQPPNRFVKFQLPDGHRLGPE